MPIIFRKWTWMGVALLFGAVWTCSSDRPAQKANLEKMEWLLGKWKLESPDRAQFEEWQRMNDSTFVGRGYVVIAGDTSLTEKLQLKMTGEKLAYVADVPHNAGPVTFYFSGGGGKQVVFENPYHDFPQTIRYMLQSENELHVEVSGTNPETGQKQIVPFQFRRVGAP